MSDAAKRILKDIRGQLGVPQRHLALLTGRDQTTISHYLNAGVIPETTSAWIHAVQEINTMPGFATIIVRMPADTPHGRYKKGELMTNAPLADRPRRRKSL